MLTPRQKLHLVAAGPSRWLSLIEDDHIQTNPAAAAQLISSATRDGINPTSLESAFVSLAKLTAATIILSTTAVTFNTQAGTEALIRLLIDTIRIAYHFTGE